jgi:aminoglycoside phosphotransferase (APT) family kinase protein
LGPADDALVYGKVGSTIAAGDVERVLETLARRAIREPHSSVLFARVLGHSRDLNLTLFSSVPGSRPDLSAQADLSAALDGAAIVAATLHASCVAAGRTRTLDGELATTRREVEQIRKEAPALAAWLIAVVDSLGAVARRTPSQALTFAHGDFTPSQLLLAGSRVGILDFDDVCQAEPALDLGRFLAYLRMGLAKSAKPSGDVPSSRFLAAYRAAGGSPTAEIRAELYGIASLVLMAVHSWRRLKSTRLQIVCDVLDREVTRLSLPLR